MSLDETIVWLKARVEELAQGRKKYLATAMGLDSSKLSKTLHGTRELTARELERAVAFFGSAPSTMTAPQWLIPIVGLAGAGPDGSVLYGAEDQNFGEVAAPDGASESARALEVRGDSMRGFANDGWIIFYEDRENPRQEHMGEACVCFLEDDRVLIKTPWPGSQRGLFHLESFNAPMMFDVPVRYFSFITDIKPRRSARKFIHNNPHHTVEDVNTNGMRKISR